MALLKTGACFTAELELNCPTVVACVTALPVGPAGVAGATQVLGKDGQFHTLPGTTATTFATPAETVAGTSSTLAVNPADLYARENMSAQTGLGLVLGSIPAPTAGQSPWGINTLGETLHYMPGVGWKIVADKYRIDTTYANPVIPTGAYTPLFSYTVPRDGRILATATLDTIASLAPAKIRLLMRKNMGDYTATTASTVAPVDGLGLAVTDQYDVTAGDVISAFALPALPPATYTAYNVTSSFTYLS